MGISSVKVTVVLWCLVRLQVLPIYNILLGIIGGSNNGNDNNGNNNNNNNNNHNNNNGNLKRNSSHKFN